MSPSEEGAGASSALDVLVKYAVVLTWIVYAAGLIDISGFLGTLGVPMDADFFAPARVFSFGGNIVLDVVAGAASAGLFIEYPAKKPNRFIPYLGWLAPLIYVLAIKRIPWWAVGSLTLKLRCAGAELVAIYSLVLLARGKDFAHRRVEQLVCALIFLGAASQFFGSHGNLLAYAAMAEPAHVQLLLPPEFVPAVSKLGLSFSTESAPGLCDPVNVVAFTDKTYYVWLPMGKLDAERQQGAVKLRWGAPRVIALPRDKVLAAAGLGSGNPKE